MVEMGLGKYPYPTENSVFAQLSAIVSGEPPSLPEDRFSPECRDFIAQWYVAEYGGLLWTNRANAFSLHKEPKKRPAYQTLLAHPWIVAQRVKDVDMKAWSLDAHQRAAARLQKQREEQQAKEATQRLPASSSPAVRQLSEPNLPASPPETDQTKAMFLGTASGFATLPRK